jgi:hypothetical protein
VRTSFAAVLRLAVKLTKVIQKNGTGWFRGVYGLVQAESISNKRTTQV